MISALVRRVPTVARAALPQAHRATRRSPPSPRPSTATTSSSNGEHLHSTEFVGTSSSSACSSPLLDIGLPQYVTRSSLPNAAQSSWSLLLAFFSKWFRPNWRSDKQYNRPLFNQWQSLYLQAMSYLFRSHSLRLIKIGDWNWGWQSYLTESETILYPGQFSLFKKIPPLQVTCNPLPELACPATQRTFHCGRRRCRCGWCAPALARRPPPRRSGHRCAASRRRRCARRRRTIPHLPSMRINKYTDDFCCIEYLLFLFQNHDGNTLKMASKSTKVIPTTSFCFSEQHRSGARAAASAGGWCGGS